MTTQETNTKHRVSREFLKGMSVGRVLRFTRTYFRTISGPQSHSVKEKTILKYQRRYGIRIFVETGTYLGDMVEAMKNSFEKVYSIELNEDLYKKAKARFVHNNNVFVLQGDSSEVLPTVLKTIIEPAIFWLDGHYSGGITSKGNLDTPIKKELESILNESIKNHVILIDDARLFNGTNDYPTYSEVTETVRKFGYVSKKQRDIIAIYRP
jgi:hypothetical protein